jgi:hypothetical protein
MNLPETEENDSRKWISTRGMTVGECYAMPKSQDDGINVI